MIASLNGIAWHKIVLHSDRINNQVFNDIRNRLLDAHLASGKNPEVRNLHATQKANRVSISNCVLLLAGRVDVLLRDSGRLLCRTMPGARYLNT